MVVTRAGRLQEWSQGERRLYALKTLLPLGVMRAGTWKKMGQGKRGQMPGDGA